MRNTVLAGVIVLIIMARAMASEPSSTLALPADWATARSGVGERRFNLNLSPDLAARNVRVMRSFFYFYTVRTDAERANGLQLVREGQRLALLQAPSSDAAGVGAALLGTLCAAVAHAPKPLRVLFEGPVHLGPALFEHGGMGVGLGGRWL